MIIDKFTCFIGAIIFSSLPCSESSCLSGSTAELSWQNMLMAVTLRGLAAWIMIAITLWGIIRLFRKNRDGSDPEK